MFWCLCYQSSCCGCLDAFLKCYKCVSAGSTNLTLIDSTFCGSTLLFHLKKEKIAEHTKKKKSPDPIYFTFRIAAECVITSGRIVTLYIKYFPTTPVYQLS